METTILKSLLSNEQYARKVIPFLKKEYFQNVSERILITKITEYMTKYSNPPTAESISIELNNDTSLNENDYTSTLGVLDSFKDYNEEHETQWLVDKTEEFCQDKAIYNAVMESISIIDGKSKSKNRQAIPSILSEALGVEFDSHVGHDFLDDYEERYDFYHTVEERIPFDLDYFNRITKGGIPRKSLNIILAGTGVGKSLALCHFAANNLMDGKNVLYITLEMAEEKIAERIDANLLNVPMDQLEQLPKQMYEKKIAELRAKTPGKLIIKEYPTASAHSGHFRHLINELKIKKSFVPDIIYVDYLNICASSRIKGMGGSINSYSFVKAIAEELRGLAVEKDVPVFSATQTTRSGYTNSDPGLEDTSESFGLPATADFMIALISTEELADLDQMMVKQLKNRYNDPTMYKRFVIGVDRARMKLYDTESSAQADVMDGPASQQNLKKEINRKDFSKLFE